MYHSLFEEVPCYLSVIDRDYTIVRTNAAFRAVFGDKVGSKCYDNYKGFTQKCPNCPIEQTFRDGLTHQSEEDWEIDGRTVHVMVKTAPIADENDQVTQVMEMCVDITRLKELQIDVEKKQDEFKYLFENVPCYLTVVDREFNVINSNKLFLTDFGGKFGTKCYEIYKTRDAKCDNCPVEKTFEDGRPHYSEEIWRKNGEETYVVVNTAPVMDKDGNITAVMEMSANITEVKRLQSELAILGETIAGMSHSIKNIVAGLEGGVYVVDSGLQKRKEDRVRVGWDMVKKNVAKISELVKGILYASKEREPDWRETDPGLLLTEICDLYQVAANTDNVTLIRDFKPEMGSFMLDPAGVHTALANVVANALDACRSHDADRQHRVIVSGAAFPERLVISISDDAGGIPREVRKKLFHKFYSTKGRKGTGLGLVMTRKIIDEHGGTIRVESEAGHGTTFIIEIPARSVGNKNSPELEPIVRH
jgi:PAS domain S-box-containing protein